MTDERSREEKLQRQLRQAGAQWKEDDLDEILALLEKDYTKQETREERQIRPALPEPQTEEPAAVTEKPRKEKKQKTKKEKSVKEKPVKEKKPLTEKQLKIRSISAIAGLSAAVLAELAVIGYMVVQWVQWL